MTHKPRRKTRNDQGTYSNRELCIKEWFPGCFSITCYDDNYGWGDIDAVSNEILF